MAGWLSRVRKMRFYLVAGVLNFGSLGLLAYYNQPVDSNHAVTVPVTHKPLQKQTLSGRPIKLTIPSLNMMLPVEDGYYNEADATWTLSGNRAHFAMPTMLANNQEGNTLIYGHNNKYVFGPLKKLKPGTDVEIQTDNGNIFYYTYDSTKVVAPDDVSIFTYEGPPILTLQTCTGNWHELRTFSTFTLTRAVKFNPNAERDRQNMDRLKASLHSLANTKDSDLPIMED